MPMEFWLTKEVGCMVFIWENSGCSMMANEHLCDGDN